MCQNELLLDYNFSKEALELLENTGFQRREVVCPGHTAGKRLGLGSGPRFETVQNLFSSTRPLHLLSFIPVFY